MKPTLVHAVDPEYPYRQMWKFFIDALQQKEHVRSWLYESLNTIQMIDTLYASAQLVST